MEENKKENEKLEGNSEKKPDFDFVIEDPYAGTIAPEDAMAEERRHHHSSHSHHHSSSHHGSHGSHSSHYGSKSNHKKKKHSTHKKAKKLKEISTRGLTLWLAILTVLTAVLFFWNIELGSQLKINSDKLSYLTGGEDSYSNNDDDLDGTKIPSYVQREVSVLVDKVSPLQNSNTVSFLAISDIHLDLNDDDAIESLTHAGQAMKLIRERLDIDFAINLGDITWGDDNTTIERGIKEIEKANGIISAGFSDIPNFRTVGNHDTLMYSYPKNKDALSSSQLYSLIGSYNEGADMPEETKKDGYCYRDFDEYKLRVITLNVNEYEDENDLENFSSCYISPEQVKWFAGSIDLSSKSDGAEWNIIVLSHQPLYWEDAYTPIVDIIDACGFESAVTVTVAGEEITYDYSGKDNARVIANFHGHLHNYRVDTVGKTRIPAVAVPNACYNRNNEYGTAESYSEDIHNKYGEKETYEKTLNTPEETAFCVITIDFEYNRIYATHYGAGYDREIGF